MQILITGGTGYLGSVLVGRLVAAGHEVVALTRSPESAAKATRAGARPLLGSLTDTALLEKAAAEADAVVHTAVDYFGGEDAIAAEAAAVEALTTATSITAEQAESAMGPMAALLRSSARITSRKARDTFGWSSSGPALPDDVRSGSYQVANT